MKATLVSLYVGGRTDAEFIESMVVNQRKL
jgi:hypothetical protein